VLQENQMRDVLDWLKSLDQRVVGTRIYHSDESYQIVLAI